jgi:hypothetical protein
MCNAYRRFALEIHDCLHFKISGNVIEDNVSR